MNPIKMWNKLSLFTKIMIGFVLGIGAGLVLGVDDKLADFVIPFGAVMNMNGTAIYEAVAAVVVAKSEGALHPEK